MVTLGRVAGLAELRVSDTGQGVAPESLPRVFEPFWQAVPVANRAMAGLGLGLAIVRHLVELTEGQSSRIVEVSARALRFGPPSRSRSQARESSQADGKDRLAV